MKKWKAYKDWFVIPEFGPEANWAAASPTLLPLANKGAWLLIHSAKDELVDIDQTTNFEKSLIKQKKNVVYLPLENDTHFGAIENLEKPKSTLRDKIVDFIKKNKR